MRPLALALALSAIVASPALAGPPWISVEFRAHRTLPDGGWLILRTFHHGTVATYPLHGTAVGIVAGRRTTLPLRFEASRDEAGVVLLAKTWSDGTPWVLNIALDDEHIGAGAVVGVGAERRAGLRPVPAHLRGRDPPRHRRGSGRYCSSRSRAAANRRAWAASAFVGFVRRNPGPLAVLAALALAVALGVGIAARRSARLEKGGPGRRVSGAG